MYKLAKWIYALGAKHERDKLKSELHYFLGWQPERLIDEKNGMTESEEHYKKRLDGWFEARKLVEEFFVEVERVRQNRQ